MLTMDMMASILMPQTEPLLSLGAGALVAMVAFLALALVAVIGTVRELDPTRLDAATDRPVRLGEPRRLAA